MIKQDKISQKGLGVFFAKTYESEKAKSTAMIGYSSIEGKSEPIDTVRKICATLLETLEQKILGHFSETGYRFRYDGSSLIDDARCNPL